MSNKRNLVVIGGGAAGFFCAVNAARMNPGIKVTLLEKSDKLLSKVKVSGGGRCNVTHQCNSIADMIKSYPRGANFLKKAFHQFFTTDTIQWFEERGVTLKTEEDGRMFPVTNSSQTIINCLLQEADKYKVEIILKTEIASIKKTGNLFLLTTAAGKNITAEFICIAGGGYAKQAQFSWLQQTGHSIESPVPSLFTFNIPKNSITELMGISLTDALVKIQGTKLKATGPLLITHWGLSGPAVLKLSAWGARELQKMNYHFSISVNWLPQFTEQSLKEKILQLRFQLASQKIINRNPFQIPQRLWEFLMEQVCIKKEIRWADLPAKEQNKFCQVLTNMSFDVKGKTTFKEEFVTCGGIKLSEVDVATMQSKLVPGLYFAGEVLDIDGVTGGYNFQNAWTTGWVAANTIAKK